MMTTGTERDVSQPPVLEALNGRARRRPVVGATLALLSGVVVAVVAVTSCFGAGFAWTPGPTPTATPPYAPPQPIGPGERWVDVNLTNQTVTAMVGNAPYYTALATTGKDGWETPVGEFHIIYRVYDETMTSASIGAEDYYVLDHVLFTQYFTNEGHALHLNYWRPESVFGREATSHGCVGMRYADAEFFWNFVGVGSRVVVHP